MATKSYSQAYAGLSAEKKSSMTEAQFTAKAKAWNQKKYGTTEPTAKAKKTTGGSKVELAKEKRRMDNPDIKGDNTAMHGKGTFYTKDSGQKSGQDRIGMRAPGVKSYHDPTYDDRKSSAVGKDRKFGGYVTDGKAHVYTAKGLVQPLKTVNIPLKSATDTKSNERIKQVVASAQGPKTRKEKRFDRRTEAGRRTKEIITDSAGTDYKTIRKGDKTKKTVTTSLSGNKRVFQGGIPDRYTNDKGVFNNPLDSETGSNTKRKSTKKSKGNYRSPSASTISSMGKLIS